MIKRAAEGSIRSLDVASITPRVLGLIAAILVCCGALAGCGGSGSGTSKQRVSTAARVCGDAQRATQPLLGGNAHLRIADSNRSYIECVLDGSGVHVDAIAQASAVAWTEYDTAAVHQAQAYGTGAVHEPSQQPHSVPGMGGNSTWIPAKQELIATNGTESRGGSYLTVTVTRRRRKAPSGVTVAAAVGRAMLAAAPRGPNPGSPPN